MAVTRRNLLIAGSLGGLGAAAGVYGVSALGTGQWITYGAKHDHASHDHPGQKRSGQDHSGQEPAGQEHSGQAHSGQEDAGHVSAKEASKLAAANFPLRYTRDLVRPPVLQPYARTTDDDGAPVEKYKIVARPLRANIVRGLTTGMLGYNGLVPGPIISCERGTRAEVTVRNQLPEVHPQWGYPLNLSTHLHGSASLPQYDGYASDTTAPGWKKTYHFPNFQPARTLWYHDHAEHITAMNAYSGLAAQYHLHDELERELLPQGEFDVPLTVSDAMFTKTGELAWDDHSHSGLWGDVVLVNGVPWPVLKVQPRIYRFRILVASIARSYRFKLSTGDPVVFVATDGGLMPRSRAVTSWRHAPAERYEVLIDFRKYKGKRIELLNASNENNIDYDYTGKVMAFDVIDAPPTTTRPDGSPDPTWNTVPDLLNPDNEVMALKASQAKKERRMRVKRDKEIWTFGGLTWHDIAESNYEKVVADPGLGDVEIWEVENSSGGWFHPVHVHLVDFQILSRNGKAPQPYELGPKDVVYVGEGETVRLLMRFGPHRGRYMVHCHNLPHEDHDMMAQFSVGWKAGHADPNDPNRAAKPVPDDAEPA